MVELEPGTTFRDFRDGLDAGGADRAEDKGEIVFPGGPGKNLRGARPHETLQSDGRYSEGGVIGVAEEFGAQVTAGVIPDVVGAQLYLTNLLSIPFEIEIRVAAALEVVEGKARHAAAGSFPEKFDRRNFGINGHSCLVARHDEKRAAGL